MNIQRKIGGGNGIEINTFKISPEFKETKMEEILEHLQENLPQYEHELFGALGKGINIKKSTFGGAIVSRLGMLITVKLRATSLISVIIDDIFWFI